MDAKLNRLAALAEGQIIFGPKEIELHEIWDIARDIRDAAEQSNREAFDPVVTIDPNEIYSEIKEALDPTL